jgi:hypothetical protein
VPQSATQATHAQSHHDNPLKDSQHSPRPTPEDVGKALNVNENDVRDENDTGTDDAQRGQSTEVVKKR